MEDLHAGDVVQIKPGPQTNCSCCFMIVLEPKPWGATGCVPVPGGRYERPMLIPLRVGWEQMEYVGRLPIWWDMGDQNGG